ELFVERLVLAQSHGESRAQRDALRTEEGELLLDTLDDALEAVAPLIAVDRGRRRARDGARRRADCAERRRGRAERRAGDPTRRAARIAVERTAGELIAPYESADRRRVARRLDFDELINAVSLRRDADGPFPHAFVRGVEKELERQLLGLS